MKKRLAIIALTISLFLPGFCFAYGGGGGGGGGGGDDDELNHQHAGGGVTWTENPNGANVIGSSVWNGRPAEIERGPYQRGTAVEDAEQALLDGLKTGLYTEEEVKANLEWAVRVKIGISDEAKDILRGTNSTSSPQAPPSQGSGGSGTTSTSTPQTQTSTGASTGGTPTSAPTAASTTSPPTTSINPKPLTPDEIRSLAQYINGGTFDKYITKYMLDYPNMDAKRLAGKMTRDICKSVRPVNKLYRPLLALEFFSRMEVVKKSWEWKDLHNRPK